MGSREIWLHPEIRKSNYAIISANLGMSCPMHVAKCTFPIQVPMSKTSECPIDILEIQFDFGNAKTKDCFEMNVTHK